jgi:hypothetical protein
MQSHEGSNSGVRPPVRIFFTGIKIDIRDYYDAALTELLDRGEIAVSPGTRGHKKVHVYHRYIPQKEASSSADVPVYPRYTGTRAPRR